ncbi:hypothetical protein SAMN04515647_2576 [Cohaesibacter sp. ES.047]|uniref:hypothetical protein n=1 Tax=Cohaesibacter sp. ES.047 TaxID=1798205 RepID=UPI000BB858F9|nr:hypothetical protein [Cohaesibacter sp. ES.047]SNY92321.1 hypothetical protein SAMN04515647_2576 [Cohaesibacter sp. ES.047]
MRFELSEAELPLSMRQFLRDIDNGQAYFSSALQKNRFGISSTLRCLVETATKTGLVAELNSATASAMINRLKKAGWSKDSLIVQKSLLRRYAYETGEGIEWALESATSDRRPIDLVTRGSHWTPYAVLVPDMISVGVTDRVIRLLDRWLRHCAKVNQLTLDHALQFPEGISAFSDLAEVLTAIDPGSPDTEIIQQARTIKRSKAKDLPKAPPYGDLPEPFLSEIKHICSSGAQSDDRITLMATAIRRLLTSAKARDLEPVLTMDTAKAFARDLHSDPIARISEATYCDSLGAFAKQAGYPDTIVDALHKRRNARKFASRNDVRRKEIKLAKNPIDLVFLAKTANEILMKAPFEENLRNRRRDFTLAGAIALLCKLPIRAKDLREGRIGKEFCRDSEGWLVDLATSKTGTAIKGRLPDCLTPYLDAVLLMDCRPEFLWSKYDERCNSPLFANPARRFRSYSAEWLRRNMTEHTCHSAHIVRTLIYDYCAMDNDLDRSVARALVGHASATSAEFYEVNADRYRVEQAQGLLRAIEKTVGDQDAEYA